METQKYTEIETTIKALGKDLEPIFNEVGELSEALENLKQGNGNHPLTELIGRITKTARRHDVDNKVKLNGNECKIGTNHQGLGYESDYSSQLSPVFSEQGYVGMTINEQYVRDILFNTEAVIDLTAIIKKSNQKTFLRLMAILKKHNLIEAFGNFKKENINQVEVVLAETDYKINVNLSRGYETIFGIRDKEDENVGKFEVRNGEGRKPSIEISDEIDGELKKILKTKFNNLSLKELKTGIFISQNKEVVVETIKSKRTLLNGVSKGYKKEYEELNDLLQPLLALEKL